MITHTLAVCQLISINQWVYEGLRILGNWQYVMQLRAFTTLVCCFLWQQISTSNKQRDNGH